MEMDVLRAWLCAWGTRPVDFLPAVLCGGVRLSLRNTEASSLSTKAIACRPAELVAKFMDNELRSGKDKKSDDMLEQTLDKALMLFRYISVSLIRIWNNTSVCKSGYRQAHIVVPYWTISLGPG